MNLKTFLFGLGAGLVTVLLLIWKFIVSVNTPNKPETPTTQKLEKQVKHLEEKRDNSKKEVVKKKILKTTHKHKEDLNEKTLSELIDMYNSKSDD